MPLTCPTLFRSSLRSWFRSSLHVVAFLVVWQLDGPGPFGRACAAPPDEPAPLEVLYHADIDGRFAAPDCSSVVPAAPTTAARSDYAGLVASLERVRARAAADGAPTPVTLLGGNLATPDLLGRGFVERGPGDMAQVAALFARGRYDAVALGHHDLSLPPATLHALVAALAVRGLPVVATNLTCEPARKALCDLVRTHLLIRRGDQTIGVVATLSPSVLPGIAAPGRSGLALSEPLAAARDAVRKLRQLGATRVILMTQGPRDLRALAEADALQKSLGATVATGTAGAAGAPDLILAGGLADEETDRALLLLRRAGAPPVVGGDPGAVNISRVSLAVGGATPPTVDLISTTTAPVDPPEDTDAPPAVDAEVQALLAPEIAAFCARYTVPIASATVRGTLSREEFLAYTLEVMRRRVGAEISLLNRAAIKRAPFPLTGKITRGQLHRALPYRAVIGVARVNGGVVETMLGSALANPKLGVAGLARSGHAPTGPLLVNGRPLDKARAYRVATIDFVAGGGDAILPAGGLPWRPLKGQPDLRETLEVFLQTATARADGDSSIDLRTDFGPLPADRTLLVGLTDIGADATDTRVANAPGYGEPQLTRADQRVLKGDATGILQVRHPAHEVDTRLNLKYGWTRSRPIDAPTVSGETADLITFTTVYNYRGLRRRTPVPRRHIPDPYVRTALESEFTRPPVTATQTRAFHHLELTNTAGALFTLSPVVKVRGGAGFRKELLTSAGELGRWRPLLEAGATLAPVALASFGALAVRLEGLVDYNFIDPAGLREHQVRGGGKLSVPLLPLLFITAGIDVFAVQRQRQGWGASYDTTVGLRVHLDGAHQWM